ncbi:hypothetical protein L5515_006405 [Caenorhabditis briggsae]|uniref:Uncharacterized protein n=1 Tax=Caenorhabditis briggsae TaxID=6238 RepID=A0AAE9JJY8_CAEBR|nr:hypothetical protein L5515_006405 [Caenorhabditis briggsae]
MSSNMSYDWKMTLFFVLTNNFKLYPEAYECSKDWTSPGAQWPKFGIYLMVSGLIFLSLYLPCFIAILKIKSSAPTYQLMSLIAVFDITSLINGSLINGYITYQGIFFCQYPLFFFITGSLALFSWLSNCIVCIFLAIERVSEVDSDFALSFLFGKKVFRILKWCIMFYSISSLLLGKSIVFSAAYGSYLYDPLIGKDPNLYKNNWVAGNNFIMAISTTTLYFYLCYYLLFKYRYSTSMWLYKSKRQIILQGIFLCFFHSATALIYEYLYFLSSPIELIIAGHVMWQISCGSLSIVYLTLNRTIRNSVLKMVIPKRMRAKFGWHIGVEEHQAVESAMDASGFKGVAIVGAVVKIDNYFPS